MHGSAPLTPVAALLALLAVAPPAPASGERAPSPTTGPPAGTDAGPAPADTVRGLTPADLFRLHRVGEVRFSPDGRRVAWELARSGQEGQVASLPLLPDVRSDVWVAGMDGGEPRRITDGASDGTGWFRPRWSPDGERLALLSVRGNRVRPWVWERDTGELRRVADRAVYLRPADPLLFRWLSARELAVAVRPPGAVERGRLQAELTRPGLFAVRGLRASWTGDSVTARVLDTGVDPDAGSTPAPAEVLVAGPDGETRVAARGPWGFVRASPRGRRLAAFGLPPLTRVPQGRPLTFEPVYGTRPTVVPLDGRAAGGRPGREGDARDPERLDAPQHGTLRWAPDGSAWAVVNRRYGEGAGLDAPGRREAVVGAVDGAGLRRLGGTDRRVAAVAWTGASQLLVRARPASAPEGEERPPAAWWRVESGGGWTRVSRGEPSTPRRLVAGPDDSAVGVADGGLWRLAPGAEPLRLAGDSARSIRRILWPDRASYPLAARAGARRGPDGPIVVEARGPGGVERLAVRFEGRDSVTLRPLPAGPGGELRDFSPSTGAAALAAEDSTGTWLRLARRGAVDTLVAADRWLADVAAGPTRKLEYESPDGETLTAWMILPPDHREGERHPTVTWVYAGLVHGEDPPGGAELHATSPVSALQLLAARGYAVLLPSMPMPPFGETADPREHMTGGVLPAVEEAVAAGLADSARVGLMGHSYGGYTVYHLVSLTDRFRAAVAMAGPVDLEAFYGTFDARARHGHMQHPLVSRWFKMAWTEQAQGRMGAPPWAAPERYRRASPLTHVERVETPLMMIHGDRDFVDVEQAEAFFTALHRQGKRARLVRYVGEGHIPMRRPNVLDMWDRIFTWFGEFLQE